MFNLKTLFYNAFIFMIGLIIFIIAFTFSNFAFYNFIGLTVSISDIICSNIKILFFVYLIIYLILKITLYLYDYHYIKKINNILSNIQGGESVDEKSTKIKFGILFTILIICAISLAIYIPFYRSKQFDNYGKENLINYLNSITDEDQKQNEIKKAIENGWITENDLH